MCAKAAKCCKLLSGPSGAAGCEALLKAPEATCTTSLGSFKKAMKATKPKLASQCD